MNLATRIVPGPGTRSCSSSTHHPVSLPADHPPRPYEDRHSGLDWQLTTRTTSWRASSQLPPSRPGSLEKPVRAGRPTDRPGPQPCPRSATSSGPVCGPDRCGHSPRSAGIFSRASAMSCNRHASASVWTARVRMSVPARATPSSSTARSNAAQRRGGPGRFPPGRSS